MSKKYRINHQINERRVFLIDENDNKLGEMSNYEALAIAESRSLDLVEVARNAFPPVCKLMDYGKHLFIAKKNQSKSKKEQKTRTREKKELQVRPTIDEHDFQVKLRQLREFLQDGCKVSIVLKFRGRQVIHPDIGLSVLRKFADAVCEIGKIEAEPVVEGKRAAMLLGPIVQK
jgi:translation initiation factor IF-3